MPARVGDEPVPGYRLVRLLGKGGIGEVWEATSPGGLRVAMKFIDLAGRAGDAELKAVRLMKTVRHAHLTQLFAFWVKSESGEVLDEAKVFADLSPVGPSGEKSKTKTLAMADLSVIRPSELIYAMGLGKMTLSDRLKECRRAGLVGIPAAELFRYLEDAARAIDFLNLTRHDLGNDRHEPIRHCDIKPQNILINGDTAEVCDFGLARVGTNVTMTTAAATLAYASPEVLEDHRPTSTTDQYALAISYVELRTGVLPFVNPNSQQGILAAHLQGKLDLSRLPAAERNVILQGTHRDPHQRFRRTLDMIKALEKVCGEDLLAAKVAAESPTAATMTMPDVDTSELANRVTQVETVGTTKRSWTLRTLQPAQKPTAMIAGLLLLVGIGGALWWYVARSGSASVTPPPVVTKPSDPHIVPPSKISPRPSVEADRLLDQAKAQWQRVRSGESAAAALSELRGTLAEGARPGVAQRAAFEPLARLADLADPLSEPSQVDAALVWFQGAADATWSNELLWSLDDLARREPAYLDRALPLAEQAVSAADFSTSDRERVRPQMSSLCVRQLQRQLTSAPRSVDTSAYFANQKQLAQQATDWGASERVVALALVESRWETSQESAAIRAQLKKLLPSGEAATSYESYVRLIVRDDELAFDDDERATLLAVARAALGGSSADELRLDFRRRKLAELLVETADALRARPTSGAGAAVEAVIHPFGRNGAAAAKQARDLLIAAEQLVGGELDTVGGPAALANLALATWYQGDKDAENAAAAKALCDRLAGKEETLAAERWPVVLLRGKLQPGTGGVSELTARADLAEWLARSKPRPSDLQVVEIHREVIAPALANDAAAAAATTAQRARLYFSAGELLRDYPLAAWGANRADDVLAMFDRAAALDPTKADYVAARGFARLSRDARKADLPLVLADAQEAIRRDAGYHGGYALQAKARLLEARRSGVDERARFLHEAVELGSKAADLAKASGAADSRAVYLLDLSTAYVELANAVDPCEPREKYLLSAKEKAQEAQASGATAFADYAFTTLGNANEDLAWLVVRPKSAENDRQIRKYYAEAIENFGKAIEARPDLPQPYMHRGRCYFKRWEYLAQGRSDHEDLIAALADLDAAINRDARLAEPRLWLGRVQVAKGEMGAAGDSFETALTLARAAASPDAAFYARLWADARLADRNYTAAELRQQADALLRDAPASRRFANTLHLIKANAFEKEANWQEALRVYHGAIGDDLSRTDADDVELLRGRAECLLLSLKRANAADRSRIATQAVFDSSRVLQILGGAAARGDYCLDGRTRAFVWLFTPAATTGRSRDELLNEALMQFDRALAQSTCNPIDPAELLRWLDDYYVLLLHPALNEGPAGVEQCYERARAAISQAQAAADKPELAAEWQRRASEISRFTPR